MTNNFSQSTAYIWLYYVIFVIREKPAYDRKDSKSCHFTIRDVP